MVRMTWVIQKLLISIMIMIHTHTHTQVHLYRFQRKGKDFETKPGWFLAVRCLIIADKP